MAACRPLETAEVARLAAACRGLWGARDRTFILLGCATGFRCSELLSLRRRDVLDGHGRVRPSLAVARRNMKKKVATRSVPLAGMTRTMLRDWLLRMENAGYVLRFDPLFPKRGARPIRKQGQVVAVEPMSRTAAWKMIRRLAGRAGIPEANVGTHSLRKTFTAAVYHSWLERLAKGERVDVLRQTQQALGHRNIQSTTAYLTSVTVEDRESSFQAAAQALAPCFPVPENREHNGQTATP